MIDNLFSITQNLRKKHQSIINLKYYMVLIKLYPQDFKYKWCHHETQPSNSLSQLNKILYSKFSSKYLDLGPITTKIDLKIDQKTSFILVERSKATIFYLDPYHNNESLVPQKIYYRRPYFEKTRLSWKLPSKTCHEPNAISKH